MGTRYRYRPNVAVFVVNRRGLVLTCERSDFRGNWQLPQGGVEEGEDLPEALIRELKEEIGTAAGEIVDRLPRKIRYDWPRHLWRDGYCGQEQTYFLFRISPHAKIDLARGVRGQKGLKQEFRSYEFLPLTDFFERVSGFRKGAYELAAKRFQQRNPGVFAE